jgi:FKBP-type peptidyl-prolyl cis-trans isomerase FkpA
MRLLFPVLMVAALAASACGGSDDSPTAPTQPSAPYSATDLVVGTGAEAVNGRNVTLNYSGWLYNPAGTDGKGQPFDSGTFGPFVLGTGNVIQGWHQGIPGMRVGGRRRLVLPPNLAYGAAGRLPQIPGNATLVFDVELINVQ